MSTVVHLVDPGASCRDTLAQLLRAEGHAVSTYPSPEAFLASPCLDCGCVLLDVRQAGADGLALQRLLTEQGSTLPVVVVAACGDVPLSVQAMKNGADDVLAEPVVNERLLDAVRRALARDARGASARERLKELRSRYGTMTPTERHVFVRVAAGMLNKQIAFDLGRSERTIKAHRSRAMMKMRANSLADLVRMADQLGVAEVGTL